MSTTRDPAPKMSKEEQEDQNNLANVHIICMILIALGGVGMVRYAGISIELTASITLMFLGIIFLIMRGFRILISRLHNLPPR